MSNLPDFDGLLNWDKLQRWIDGNELPGSGPVTTAQRLAGGSQNNVFLMERGGERFVLRRPPRHPRANSDETMLREARLLKALRGSAVPHPRFFAACDDKSILGTCFYAMEALEGFSPVGPLPGRYATEPGWRRAMGGEMVRAAVALAAIDHRAVGLSDFGKPDAWHARQVERWRSQLEGYRNFKGYAGPELPHVDEIGRWLGENLPKDRRIGVIHGDFQYPNAMYSMAAPRITGLIDWELATLGDPLLDLGFLLQGWFESGDTKKPVVTPWDDAFMKRAELIDLYGRLSGRDMSEIAWFHVLACYKLGVVLEGTYARAHAGQASMEIGRGLHNYTINLFSSAKRLISEGTS